MIKFGTDGWRARIADEFTFENVRSVAQAIINHVKTKGDSSKSFYIGYDNRFLSESFAVEVAKVAVNSAITCFLSKEPLPSPALSFAVKANNASGGIMITASHNPPEYNGIKFKAHYGGSSLPELTREVEAELAKIYPDGPKIEAKADMSKIRYFPPKENYYEQILSLVDLKVLSKLNINVVIDPMHGSASGYLTELLAPTGINVIEINAGRDPLFGGLNPEPLPLNLADLTSAVKEKHMEDPGRITVGFALDGDGDRIAAVDQTGQFINPHNIFAILLKHLVEEKKLSGDVVKTFNGSNLIDSLSKKYGLTMHETPIGFKYICELMLERDILIGGEESGGIGIKGHIPERDAVLAALLLLEAIAAQGKPLKAILDGIMDEFGYYFYDRIDLHLEEQKKIKVIESLKNSPPKIFAGRSIANVKTLDGIKLIADDGSWILFRASGTEPLLRIYCEATSRELAKKMLFDGEDLTK